jgi:hypothetical protein
LVCILFFILCNALANSDSKGKGNPPFRFSDFLILLSKENIPYSLELVGIFPKKNLEIVNLEESIANLGENRISEICSRIESETNLDCKFVDGRVRVRGRLTEQLGKQYPLDKLIGQYQAQDKSSKEILFDLGEIVGVPIIQWQYSSQMPLPLMSLKISNNSLRETFDKMAEALKARGWNLRVFFTPKAKAKMFFAVMFDVPNADRKMQR